MFLKKSNLIVYVVLVVLAVVGTGCPTQSGYDTADLTNGGLLYDKWWSVAGVAEPTEDHPFWETRPDEDSNSRTGKDTWRCKECHGWDYKGVDGAYGGGSHRTGFDGIFDVVGAEARSKSRAGVFSSIKTAHGFGSVLSRDEVWDLTKFVMEGQLDTDDIIDANGAFIGDTAAGKLTYDSTCAACHGSDGLTPPPGAGEGYDDYVGKISNDNPWEMQHKISFGQPATAMPAQIDVLTIAEIGDLGAYLQTLPTEPAPSGFDTANAVRGGLLYDKWWAVAGLSEPTTDHPLWATRPDQDSNTRTGKDTWRCKECHGWDYKGVDGAYGGGSHRTGFAGISGVADATIRSKSGQDVFDSLKATHSLDGILADDDFWDLAKFVLEGQLDTADIVDEAGAFIGDAVAGQTIYDGTCAACHGSDGLTPPGANQAFEDFPGVIADANPWEMQHKISFGQPATGMPPQFTLLSVPEIGDLGVYLQTLPTE